MVKHLKIFVALSLIVQIVFIKIIAKFPEFVERYYSNGLYVYISKMMRYSFGWVPFSIGDILYTLLGIYIIRWIVINRKRVRSDTKSWLLDILSTLSIAYFAFHILWAFNYYRIPLHSSLQLERDYNTEQLIAFTQKLIDKTNSVQQNITGSDTVKVTMPYSKTEMLKSVPQGYEELKEEYPHLAYSPRSVKRSLYSLPLTYMGFSGYLNPFTNEAQIDGLIPLYKYPTTASHEIAHQLGYAAENEANFIGSLAAIRHPDKYFNYSGYSFALSHCLNEIFLRDPLLYEALMGTVNIGVLKNFNEMYIFWQSYQNPAEPLFKSTYSRFLKANNQSLGMDSYSYVVALLVNYFEKNEL
ncbi:Protein of unknown function [Flavobacteriaceae bacterium MAR_2010_188]|nr:Protein of unknown function [Flavobacteriaceae bacterium MAR_2010_188]